MAGGHARHDAERHAGCGQRQRLLAAAPEHQGIAALEPHDAQTLARELDQALVDLELPRALAPGPLADRLEARRRAAQRQDLRRHQRIVQDHVGLLERVQRVQGEQARIARPGADQPDAAGRDRGKAWAGHGLRLPAHGCRIRSCRGPTSGRRAGPRRRRRAGCRCSSRSSGSPRRPADAPAGCAAAVALDSSADQGASGLILMPPGRRIALDRLQRAAQPALEALAPGDPGGKALERLVERLGLADVAAEVRIALPQAAGRIVHGEIAAPRRDHAHVGEPEQRRQLLAIVLGLAEQLAGIEEDHRRRAGRPSPPCRAARRSRRRTRRPARCARRAAPRAAARAAGRGRPARRRPRAGNRAGRSIPRFSMGCSCPEVLGRHVVRQPAVRVDRSRW